MSFCVSVINACSIYRTFGWGGGGVLVLSTTTTRYLAQVLRCAPQVGGVTSFPMGRKTWGGNRPKDFVEAEPLGSSITTSHLFQKAAKLLWRWWRRQEWWQGDSDRSLPDKNANYPTMSLTLWWTPPPIWVPPPVKYKEKLLVWILHWHAWSGICLWQVHGGIRCYSPPSFGKWPTSKKWDIQTTISGDPEDDSPLLAVGSKIWREVCSTHGSDWLWAAFQRNILCGPPVLERHALQSQVPRAVGRLSQVCWLIFLTFLQYAFWQRWNFCWKKSWGGGVIGRCELQFVVHFEKFQHTHYQPLERM